MASAPAKYALLALISIFDFVTVFREISFSLLFIRCTLVVPLRRRSHTRFYLRTIVAYMCVRATTDGGSVSYEILSKCMPLSEWLNGSALGDTRDERVAYCEQNTGSHIKLQFRFADKNEQQKCIGSRLFGSGARGRRRRMANVTITFGYSLTVFTNNSNNDSRQ